MNIPNIDISEAEVSAFCKRWIVTELALFGSVLQDDCGADSAIDVLIRFESEPTPGLLGIVRMERELSELFGRPVDLVTRGASRTVATISAARRFWIPHGWSL